MALAGKGYVGWESGSLLESAADPLTPSSGANCTVSSSRPNTGTYHLRSAPAASAAAYQTARIPPQASGQDLYLKFDWYHDNAYAVAGETGGPYAGTASTDFFALLSSASNPKISLAIRKDGKIEVRDKTGSVVATTAAAIAYDRYARIELRLAMSLGGGTSAYELRVDGSSVLTGAGDFRQAIPADAATYAVFGRQTAGAVGWATAQRWDFDDLVVNPVPVSGDTWPGAKRIVHLRPTGDGFAMVAGPDWQKGGTLGGSTTLPYWDLVDDFDGDSTWWSRTSGINGAMRCVDLSPASAVVQGPIVAVTPFAMYRSSASPVLWTYKFAWSDGGGGGYEEAAGPTVFSDGQYHPGYGTEGLVNPINGSTWSLSALDSMQVGAKHPGTNSGTVGYISHLALQVVYDVPQLSAAATMALRTQAALTVTGGKTLAAHATLALLATGSLLTGPATIVGLEGQATLRLRATGLLAGNTGLSGAATLSLRSVGTLETHSGGHTPRTRVDAPLDQVVAFEISLGLTARIADSLILRVNDSVRLLISPYVGPPQTVHLGANATLALLSSGVLANRLLGSSTSTLRLTTSANLSALAVGITYVDALGTGGGIE